MEHLAQVKEVRNNNIFARITEGKITFPAGFRVFLFSIASRSSVV
jgi:hypothetical protein